jgi:hypothetical protein
MKSHIIAGMIRLGCFFVLNSELVVLAALNFWR